MTVNSSRGNGRTPERPPGRPNARTPGRPIARALARAFERAFGWSLKPPPTSTERGDDDAKDASILTMLRALGVAMLASSQATNDVETTLYDIAETYHLTGIRIAVLPTMVILQLDPIAPGGQRGHGSVSTETGTQRIVTGSVAVPERLNSPEKLNDPERERRDLPAPPSRSGRTDIDTISNLSIRLDQAAAIDELVHEAQLGQLNPDDAMGRLAVIRASKPRFSPWMVVVGHTVLCLGFGLTLNPSIAAVPAYIVLGAGVGLLLLLGRRLPTLASAMPVFAAFLVTVATSLFLAQFAGDDPLRLIAPALVSFLPGLTLTVASIELTSNQIIAGASRIVYGIAQLLLLAFGVIAGLTVTRSVTPNAAALLSGAPTVGWYTAVIGVALVGVGFVLFLSAPKRSFLWILVALFAAYGAQTLGALTIGAELSGFVGALVIVPLSRVLSRFRTAPPATVMMLASFWLLVPGALGFIGVNEAAAANSSATTASSIATIVNTGLSLFSIALGILVGTGLTRDFSHARKVRAGR